MTELNRKRTSENVSAFYDSMNDDEAMEFALLVAEFAESYDLEAREVVLREAMTWSQNPVIVSLFDVWGDHKANARRFSSLAARFQDEGEATKNFSLAQTEYQSVSCLGKFIDDTLVQPFLNNMREQL